MLPIQPAHFFRQIYWASPERIVVIFFGDWPEGQPLPQLVDLENNKPVKLIEHAAMDFFGRKSGYFRSNGEWVFVFYPEMHPAFDYKNRKMYVAGDFNKWEKGVGLSDWLMEEVQINGRPCLIKKVPLDFFEEDAFCFKFVSEDHEWLSIPPGVFNLDIDANGNTNFRFNKGQSGHHIFYATLADPLEWGKIRKIGLFDDHGKFLDEKNISYEQYLLSLKSELQMGAIATKNGTTFRLFAPRASRVTVIFFDNLKKSEEHSLELEKKTDGAWEGYYEFNLHGYYYYYRVDGINCDKLSMFDYNFKILDPYALATVGHEGPGIIIDTEHLISPSREFRTPAWHDLVIMEAHIRDLLQHAPIELKDEERLGFSGLAKWIRTPNSYIRELGINAIELQPVQEFDSASREDYHWGYMPVNYFAPESTFAQASHEASQIDEFRDLVEAFHEAGISVILDVVYNHVGNPAHLMFIDKYYYFHHTNEGDLTNWSGCGNDFRADTWMGKRIIIESLLHWIRVFNVDGFRFDLADLMGVEVLAEVEKIVKAYKPSVILIAEPWSFRGHIGHALKATGYSSWNDGYRDFVRDYILGEGNVEGLTYYLKGCLDHLTRFPAQTVNYVESHDDYCWIDRITENPDNNASIPTARDRRRTHLMVAILMLSLGIPMIAQGMDALRSKNGMHNTYQRGNINALDYNRRSIYPGTYRYFRQWIRFRLSHLGRFFRLDKLPTPYYLQFFNPDFGSALAVLYNADYSWGGERLLFAVNPHLHWSFIKVGHLKADQFRQIADQEIIDPSGLAGESIPWVEGRLELPPLSCGLWIQRPQ